MLRFPASSVSLDFITALARATTGHLRHDVAISIRRKSLGSALCSHLSPTAPICFFYTWMQSFPELSQLVLIVQTEAGSHCRCGTPENAHDIMQHICVAAKCVCANHK